MFISFEQWTFAELSWLSVIAYILHYAEEGPRLVAWFENHHTGRTSKKLKYTQKKLNTENALLFSFMLLNVVLLNVYPDNMVLKIGILGSGFGFVGNTFFHVIPTLRTGIYSPGVVTASMFFPPLLFVYIWKMNQEGLLSLLTLLAALVAGLIMLPIVISFTHNVLFYSSDSNQTESL